MWTQLYRVDTDVLIVKQSLPLPEIEYMHIFTYLSHIPFVYDKVNTLLIFSK